MRKIFDTSNDFKISGFYSAFIRYCSEDFFFPGETHDFWEVVYCIKGEAYVSQDEKIINLLENQIIFHKPMEFHSLRIEKKTDTELFIMSFEATGRLMDSFKNKIFFLSKDQKRSLMDIMAILRTDDNIIEDEIYLGFLESLSKKPYGMNVLKNLTENFLISLSETSAAPTELVKNNETSTYSMALSVIDESIFEKITVEELSKRCNVSSAYLKKIFDKYNGLGIHEYIFKNKIILAKQMLSKGESVTETAYKLGFSSQHYFSTAFKRETGISPSEYKKTGM